MKSLAAKVASGGSKSATYLCARHPPCTPCAMSDFATRIRYNKLFSAFAVKIKGMIEEEVQAAVAANHGVLEEKIRHAVSAFHSM